MLTSCETSEESFFGVLQALRRTTQQKTDFIQLEGTSLSWLKCSLTNLFYTQFKPWQTGASHLSNNTFSKKEKLRFKPVLKVLKGLLAAVFKRHGGRRTNSWLSFTTLWSGEKDLGPQSFYIASPSKDQLDGKSILFAKTRLKTKKKNLINSCKISERLECLPKSWWTVVTWIVCMLPTKVKNSLWQNNKVFYA